VNKDEYISLLSNVAERVKAAERARATQEARCLRDDVHWPRVTVVRATSAGASHGRHRVDLGNFPPRPDPQQRGGRATDGRRRATYRDAEPIERTV